MVGKNEQKKEKIKRKNFYHQSVHNSKLLSRNEEIQSMVGVTNSELV